MSGGGQVSSLISSLLGNPRQDLSIVLDAAAVSEAGELATLISRHEGRVILTPHHGEMARLKSCDMAEVEAAPIRISQDAAAEFNAVVVLKSGETFITMPSGNVGRYSSDCIGLATGGSGDVLAGAIGGLLSRGASPTSSAGWGVWIHREAGRALSSRIGRIGFLARELAAEFPGLMQL